ncbi:hypothetical protein ACFL2J_06665 [Candidatus Omnitrophota bacterium]
MKRFLILGIFVFMLSGCFGGTKPYVLTDSEVMYFIPAGTEFDAVVEQGKPTQKVVRDEDSWNVEAGTLATLQEEANANVLSP